jgi:diacylglycerol O-acyltransferase
MSFMPPTDSMFLLAENRDHPMHVGGLQLFVPPEGSGPEQLSQMHDAFSKSDDVSPLFRKRPGQPIGTRWITDESLDFDHHVRHSAVPGPGRIRELLQLTSRLHGSLLDRHRPLWETHVIEGLADGRIAIYHKIHHSMVDGVSAIRLLQSSLSEDPDARDCRPTWAVPTRSPSSTSGKGLSPLALVDAGRGALTDIAGIVPAGLRIARQVVRDHGLALPQAPKTILNGPVGSARRFAAQSWELERIQRVSKSSATTLNDVVLAMVSGALRAYLLEQHALPDEPMTAMVPVSLTLRSGQGSDSAPGNATGAIVVNLATDREAGATRLEEIAYSSRQAKKVLHELTPTQILAVSAMQMLPLAMTPIPGFVRYTNPPFNVIVSNVPGPRKPMYFNGSRLDGSYPMSIVTDGQALNITLSSRDKYLDFGIVGCRKSVPHLQRLLLHLESSLAELEQSWG